MSLFGIAASFLLLVLLSFAKAGNLEQAAAVVKFWESRRWRTVAVLSLGQQGSRHTRSSSLVCSMVKHSRSNGIRVKSIVESGLGDMFPWTVKRGQTDYVTILVKEKPDQRQIEITTSVLMRSVAFSVLLVTWVDIDFSFLSAPVGFYLMRSWTGNGGHISRIIATRQQSTQNLKTRESMELSPPDTMPGAYLKMVTLPYEPFLFMEGCSKEPHLPCKSVSGSLIDVMRFLSSEGNFTYNVFLEPSGKWDHLPESPENMDDGVSKNSSLLGGVYFGRNDLPLSTWTVNSKRKNYADFTASISEEQTLCFASAQQIHQGSSTKFLFQPISEDAWRCLLILTTCVILGISLFSFFKMESLEGAKAWMSVGGLAYTVAMAYYSGGQTMFLVSKPNVPFNDIISGALSEDWKVIVANGDETIFQNLFPTFAKEHPLIKSLVKNFKANPKTMKQVLQELNHSKSFLASLKSRVAYFLQKYPTSGPSLLVPFCTPRTTTRTFLIPQSSPFKATLNKGLQRMRQSGAMRAAWRRWHRLNGQSWDMGATGSVKPRSITFWKVAWAFRMGGFTTIFVLILVAIEKVVHAL